jgi:26S proteasome regulatory subunit N3
MSGFIPLTRPAESPVKASLLAYIPEAESHVAMDLDTPAPTPKSKPIPDVPECEVYLRLLIIQYLLATETTRPKALELVHETVTKIQAWNRRTMDPIGARIYTALGRVYELVASVEPAQIRSLLLSAQRTASLRRDDETLAVLINLLLRNYLHYNLYAQADKLVAKVPFPESAGNPQLARYYYYVGRIRAVQLNYSDAHEYLQQATRRAPSATTAPGFYQIVHKFFIVVELLMGDIPERSLFRQPVLEKALSGYIDIVKGAFTCQAPFVR